MLDKFSVFFGNLAVKLNSNKYVSTIKNSFMQVIPFTIAGSIGTLLGSVLFASNSLGGVQGFEFLQELSPWFTQLNYATMNILALLIAYNVGKNLAQEFGSDGSFEGLLSLVCFILVSPTTVTQIVDGKSFVVNNVLHTNVTSSRGLFVAMIVGMISVRLFIVLSKVEKLEIRLPDMVPANIAKSFSSLIPTIIVTVGVSGFAFFFEKIVGQNISDFIFSTLQAPIGIVFQHPLGIIFSGIFAALFWIVGIHGASIVTGIINPITYEALQKNMDAVAAGLQPTEIVTKPFWNMYITMGGFGCTLALLIAIFIASKREDDRAIAKLSVGPGLFGINEPVIFGLPIVMNPLLAIPFVITPSVCALIGYLSIKSGFAAPIISDIPWSMPPVVNGFIATGGDINTAITQIFAIVVSVFIWLPFVIVRNKEIEMINQEN